MSVIQYLITIAMLVVGTMATRFLVFILFPAGKETPSYVKFLGQALPAAAIGMLIVYCLKSVSIMTGSHGLPELISIVLVVILHLWKKQTLLSIAAGTVCYMVMVQFVF